MMGALDWRDHRLIVATSKTRRSTDFIAFLEELDHRYGPKPGQCQRPVVIVLDNGPIHTSKATRTALAARAHWLSVEWPSVAWLLKYAPELNDIETVWHDLKADYLAHPTFTDTEDLTAQSTTPSRPSTANENYIRWPTNESLLGAYRR